MDWNVSFNCQSYIMYSVIPTLYYFFYTLTSTVLILMTFVDIPLHRMEELSNT